MNHVVLIGRLTKDPEVRYDKDTGNCQARYVLAVDKYSKNNERSADFIQCMCFGAVAEFAEKYLRKGTKIAVQGRINTGHYENLDHERVYYTNVIVNSHEFCERKSDQKNAPEKEASSDEGFMNIPDGIDDALPFA